MSPPTSHCTLCAELTALGLQADSNFVGKGVLLHWLNSTLQLKLEKIEDVGCTRASMLAAQPSAPR